jgi:TetR/AcrR family transcriptional regulator
MERVGMPPVETKVFSQLTSEKRQRILDAAINEFAERGYGSASMNVVVERAGISKGALFKYFQSKQGLFGYIYRIALNEVKDYLREVRDGSRDENFFERLRRVLEAGVRFISSHPQLARIYYRLIYAGDSPDRRDILYHIQRESLKFIQSLVEQGIDRGELRKDLDPQIAAFFLVTLLDRFLQARHFEFLDPTLSLSRMTSVQSGRSIDEIVQIFRKGMASPGSDRKKAEGSRQ